MENDDIGISFLKVDAKMQPEYGTAHCINKFNT
jgi:hypothetical protein